MGWTLSALGDLRTNAGLFADGDWIESKDQDPNGQNRLLQLADIGDGYFISKSSRYVNNETFSRLNCTALKEGDILIARMPDPLGRACLMPPMPQRCLTVVDVAIFRSGTNDINHRLLMHAINAAATREEIWRNSSGTTRKRIARGKLAELEIPLPPAAEQKRIVLKLDALLAQVDTLKARIDAIPVLIKRFRQAVRVAALTGELERERLIETAEWKSCVLSDVAIVETGKTPDRSEPRYWTNGSIAWVTSAATGSGTCEEAKEFVTPQAVKECSLKLFAPETLLLAMYGEGKTRGQVTELRIHAACNQACAAISVDRQLAELGFVKLRLEENYESIRKMAVGGAQPNLNLGKVREIPISLPSKEIQADIVRRVNQLFAFADQLEAQVLAAKQRVDTLTQSLLAKALRGELVPQDPSDEPASVLLERIRAQRAAVPKPKRGRKAASN